MPYDAHRDVRVKVPEDGVYFCHRCKKNVNLFQKMYHWLCSECRIVLINA